MGQTSFSTDRSFGATTSFTLLGTISGGVFCSGRFDRQLGGVRRQMMQEINSNMPKFGVTPAR